MLTFYIYLDKQIHFCIITNILYACKQHSPYADCLTICLSIVMCKKVLEFFDYHASLTLYIYI